MEPVDRIAALRSQHSAVYNFCGALTDEQWRTPSKVPGWTIADVVAKMTSTCRLLLTADALKVVTTRSIDRAHDLFVQSRRSWDRDHVLEEFTTWGGRAIALLETVGRTPARSLPVPLGEIGQFPVGKLPSLLTFDWHTHLALDMAPPLGATVPPLSAMDLSVALEWMFSVLAQSKSSAAALTDPVQVRLAGTVEHEWLIAPDQRGRVTVTPGSGEAVATIEGEGADFPSWGTNRTTWREHNLQISGDRAAAERFLDSVNI